MSAPDRRSPLRWPRDLRRSPRSPCTRRAFAASAADPKKVVPRRVPGRRRRASIPPRCTIFTPPASCSAIFETLYTYDYLARPAKIVPQAADGMPRGDRRRQDVHDQAHDGHPVRGRSGVRRQAARAHRRRHRVLVQAARRSEDPLAVGVPGRGQVRRPRRRDRGGQEIRRSTTTRRSPALEAVDRYTVRFRLQRHRLQPVVRAGARGDVDRRARSDRESTANPMAA